MNMAYTGSSRDVLCTLSVVITTFGVRRGLRAPPDIEAKKLDMLRIPQKLPSIGMFSRLANIVKQTVNLFPFVVPAIVLASSVRNS
jgi:hypothetical protein